MKKIQLKESDLIDLIEKLVKENLSNGNAQNLGMMNTPTAKYKDLLEKEDVEEGDIEEEDATHEEEDNVNESKKTKKTLSLTEAQLVSLIERVVKEQESGDDKISNELELDLKNTPDDEDSWFEEKWEDLTDDVKEVWSKIFTNCTPKSGCPAFDRTPRQKLKSKLRRLTSRFPKLRLWPKWAVR
tara:strand:- start:873 stop:1427 length:555 start_codon:yes stop_codon:yes gene_type:complete